MAKMKELYVFIDNSFLFIQGYKYVKKAIPLCAGKKPQFNYAKFKTFLSKKGEIKRIVLVGSELPSNIMASCQRNGFEVFTLPRYPDMKSAKPVEKGVDQKLCWEIAKTIFTNRNSTADKQIILCTGDKDFASIFSDIQTSSWGLEVLLWDNSASQAYIQQAQVFGTVQKLGAEWKKFIDIVDSKAGNPATPVRKTAPKKTTV
ncbi:MAG: NYN domain-containing protein [Victivallaceae bacterium]|nr:NYN domain-containing protein [Victivallaceae bacterium]